MTMTIDMHTHVAPRQAVKIAESGGTWHGVEFYRDKNDKLTTSYGNLKMSLPWPKKWKRQMKDSTPWTLVKLICIY